MKQVLALPKVFVIAACMAFIMPAHAKEHKADVITLDTLKPLVGTWQNKERPNSQFRINFELIANDTVLVEKWLRAGKTRSLTLYHQDGSNLLATHYCPQGNQPRLKLTPGSTTQMISFKFQDATNLATIDDNHQHSLGLKLPTETSDFIRSEMYLSKNGEENSALTLMRVGEIN